MNGDILRNPWRKCSPCRPSRQPDRALWRQSDFLRARSCGSRIGNGKKQS